MKNLATVTDGYSGGSEMSGWIQCRRHVRPVAP